ncbi:MAG TPA: hypothetical protein VMY42_05595 [Thermoguttaceae bacterium]|nr:hypothetical protein [Thermoguttaceae bacterium]
MNTADSATNLHCCNEEAAPDDSASRPDDSASRPDYDGWELDQQLEHIHRVLAPGKTDDPQFKTAHQQEVSRLDPPHAGPPQPHLRPAGKPALAPRTPTLKNSASRSFLTWTTLLLGTMAFVCGGVLLGWSLLGGRPELWNLGLPVALGGQIALLVGLVLQLDRLWYDSRHAAAKLDDVDEQLHELRTTTTLLGTGHLSPSSAFYSHLADGANTELLLTDLKGQLDLLALKISMNDKR